jgi:hypothetical protein
MERMAIRFDVTMVFEIVNQWRRRPGRRGRRHFFLVRNEKPS